MCRAERKTIDIPATNLSKHGDNIITQLLANPLDRETGKIGAGQFDFLRDDYGMSGMFEKDRNWLPGLFAIGHQHIDPRYDWSVAINTHEDMSGFLVDQSTFEANLSGGPPRAKRYLFGTLL